MYCLDYESQFHAWAGLVGCFGVFIGFVVGVLAEKRRNVLEDSNGSVKER